MAQLTFHFVVAKSQSDLLQAIRNLPSPERPLYVGRTHHWIHSPQVISVKALLGDGPRVTRWDYLLIFHSPSGPDQLALPTSLEPCVAHKWSISAPAFSDDAIAAYPAERERRATQPHPPLPSGWSATDHSGLDAAEPPLDLEVSLGLTSHLLGANRETDQAVSLRDLCREFGKKHSGPVQMLNLDSTNPGKRMDFYGYIQAFGASIGIRYGGEAAMHGTDPTDWSSRMDEGEVTVQEAKEGGKYGLVGGQVVGWEEVPLVWYPSVWHFAKMLDDPEYAEADRKYKTGVLRDGPLIMCTEVEL